MNRLLNIILILTTFVSATLAQDYLGIYGVAQNGAYAFANGGSLPSEVGPFYLTPNNATTDDPANGSVGVKAIYRDQQYTDMNEPNLIHDAMLFGAQSNNTNKVLLNNKPLFVQMSDVGTPNDTFFMPRENIEDMSVSSHYAFEQYVSVEGLQNANVQSDGRYYMGTITYEFTRPVDNPILHVVGLGGFFSSVEEGVTNHFAVDYQIIPEQATSMVKLDGSKVTELSDIDNATDNLVENGTTLEEFLSDQIAQGTDGEEAGSGSFLIQGTNIDSVRFEIYIDGLVPDQPYWSSSDTEAEQKYTGDRFNTTWTLPVYNFGGSVVLDNIIDGTVSGSPYTNEADGYEQLYAVLVDEEGNVAQVVAVDANDGTFDFSGVLGDNYTVQLQTSQPTVGDPAPASAGLPTSYVSTEEEFVNGGSDSTPNSITNAFLVSTSTEDDINDNSLILGIKYSVALPVELISFEARSSESDAILTWETATEINNELFVVERSIDGFSFQEIGKVDGAGSSTEVNDYHFVDSEIGVTEKLAYYRLKQVDFDGSYSYSEIRAVKWDDTKEQISITLYPNPAHDIINLELEGISLGEARLLIVDQHGKQLRDLKYDNTKDWRIDITDLQAAPYFIKVIQSDRVIANKKFIKIN